MFYFESHPERLDEPEPDEEGVFEEMAGPFETAPSRAIEPEEAEHPLRLRLAAEPEPAPGPAVETPDLYKYPPAHQRESIALRFTAIRYDLELRGGRKPGSLK